MSRTVALMVAVACGAALTVGQSARAEERQVERLAGEDRFSTAVAVSEAAYEPGVEVVFVATGTQFPDALAAGAAAAVEGGPVLLVTRDRVPEPTVGELERLEPSGIVVLGGVEAISEEVASRLERLTEGRVSRVAGATRFGTAARISARTFQPGVAEVFVASGERFPDALAGAAAAGSHAVPVLLVTREVVPDATEEELRRLGPDSISVLGGSEVVSDAVIERLQHLTEGPVRRVAGADRFATSAAVARHAFDAASVVYLATGRDFPDALAAGPVAGTAGAPILLSATSCVPQVVLDEMELLGVERVVLLGGPAALDDGVERLVTCAREVAVIVEGLEHPWDAAFTPDGRTFISERDSGRLVEHLDGAVREVRQLDVAPAGEGGLLGLATSPTYAEDGLLYAYLSSRAHGDNRVVRFRPDEGGIEPILTGIPYSSTQPGRHSGGRITFGPDGLLYVGTGDAVMPERSQDRQSLAGKILRVRPDGTAPADNPFGSAIWAYGLRNAQGLTWDREGTFYASELGPECDDEINRIVRGGNYGWPDGCGETREGAIAPIIVKQPPEASWSGATFLNDGAIPEWEGDLFVAALRGQRLWRLRLADGDPDHIVEEEELLVGEYGRLRQVRQAPDGSLWILTTNGSNDRIIRIGPPRG